MRVKSLIDELSNFDEDAEVCIGMYQDYGSDFAIKISDVQELDITDFFYGEEKSYITIIQGEQFGQITN